MCMKCKNQSYVTDVFNMLSLGLPSNDPMEVSGYIVPFLFSETIWHIKFQTTERLKYSEMLNSIAKRLPGFTSENYQMYFLLSSRVIGRRRPARAKRRRFERRLANRVDQARDGQPRPGVSQANAPPQGLRAGLRKEQSALQGGHENAALPQPNHFDYGFPGQGKTNFHRATLLFAAEPQRSADVLFRVFAAARPVHLLYVRGVPAELGQLGLPAKDLVRKQAQALPGLLRNLLQHGREGLSGQFQANSEAVRLSNERKQRVLSGRPANGAVRADPRVRDLHGPLRGRAERRRLYQRSTRRAKAAQQGARPRHLAGLARAGG